MTDRGQELYAYFQAHKEDFLNILQSLVEQETPSHDPDSFTSLISILRREFEDLNFTAEHHAGNKTAGQLLFTPPNYNPEKPSQLIIGHCDTVWEKGTLANMPFKNENNTVSGPGIYDMKAGITMMIFAMRAINDLEKSPSVQPVFLVTTDEEIGSTESKELIIEQAKKAERTLVLEPSLGIEGKIKTRRKGVGQFEIAITGKPSHAGLAPEEGVSAILGLSHIVQQLFRLNDPEKGISVNVGTIAGGERTNVIAAKSKAAIDVRVPTEADGKRIKKKIYNLKPEISEIDIEVTGGINRPPLEKKEANQKLWQVLQKLGSELDLDLEEGTSGGASDGNFTNRYSPTIDGLGAVGEGAHAYHEKILLDETLNRNALLVLLILYSSINF